MEVCYMHKLDEETWYIKREWLGIKLSVLEKVEWNDYI